jgi:hypothetical protein
MLCEEYPAVCEELEERFQISLEVSVDAPYSNDFPSAYRRCRHNLVTWNHSVLKRRNFFNQNNPLYIERCSKMKQKEDLLQRHYYQKTVIVEPS